MIELSDVSVVRGVARLLDGVSLSFGLGAMAAVIGANGAGKSTLLRVISGFVPPSSGSVQLLGRPLSSYSGREQARLRALVTQRTDVAFGFSAREIVLLGRIPHMLRSESRADVACVASALERVDLAHLADRDVTTLSAGERQRVEIARALAQLEGPGAAPQRALLMDEPTSNLDLCHQHAVLELCREAAREGALVLVILHDLNLAAQYAQRIVVMDRGRIVADGVPRAVLTPALIERAFRLRVQVLPHPELDCPLIVSNPKATGRSVRSLSEPAVM